MSLQERLKSSGPKRILSLDGGGIRGALSLGFVEQIETILRQRHNNPNLRLCEYFDLIGGTSTGAIIATALAIGMEAAEIRRCYFELGGKIFHSKRSIFRWAIARYQRRPFIDALQRVFGETKLGDDAVQTGLCVFAKRADTRSTWTLMNHPDWKFYPYNKDVALWEAIRASTAAPTFFIPEKMYVGNQYGAFVDGAVSMVNNPALRLMMISLIEGYGFKWPRGKDNLLLVSIGTGYAIRSHKIKSILRNTFLNWAVEIPKMMLEDANWQNQKLLQYMSNSPTSLVIDSAIGDLRAELLADKPLLSYLRYDVSLDTETLLGYGVDQKIAEKGYKLYKMDRAENRFDLADVGSAAAAQLVEAEHFPDAFDIP